MSLDFHISFYFLLPIVALLYSSVGHGGASGYLALMALFNSQPELMKSTALILNLFVAGASFLFYWKEGYFKRSLFLPFVITSIPAAFIGGLTTIDPMIYKKILGILLLLPIIKLSGLLKPNLNQLKKPVLWQSLFIGLFIGYFSGLIGIGGGIILSPVILLLHWSNMKETAAVSALFIWINSLAGLSGMMVSGLVFNWNISLLVGIALIGGLIGSFLGSKKMNNLVLQRVLSLVLIIASIKLLLT